MILKINWATPWNYTCLSKSTEVHQVHAGGLGMRIKIRSTWGIAYYEEEALPPLPLSWAVIMFAWCTSLSPRFSSSLWAWMLLALSVPFLGEECQALPDLFLTPVSPKYGPFYYTLQKDGLYLKEWVSMSLKLPLCCGAHYQRKHEGLQTGLAFYSLH